MKKLRILPGAAGVIALTATIGFIDGKRDYVEGGSISRGKIALIGSLTSTATGRNLPDNKPVLKSDKPIYLVEIRRGNKFVEVIIDAVTGQILPFFE